jgi:DNA modification methylase
VPKQNYDLIFSCPPYYKVETYLDYDGKSPEGELNSLSTYEQFRDMLFEGYKNAISVMNDNTFFVVMTGDSRNKDGGYYCSDAEHELFFKEQGLHVYNKIIYLESEFTRRATAKKTLNSRKYPKCEQRIYVFYKGDTSKIKDLYPNIGRL